MIPNLTDSRWDKLLQNPDSFQFQLLGLKILMGRIKMKLGTDNSRENLFKCKEEVYSFFVKNEKIIQKDLSQIFK
jgi:hypothetical protein